MNTGLNFDTILCRSSSFIHRSLENLNNLEEISKQLNIISGKEKGHIKVILNNLSWAIKDFYGNDKSLISEDDSCDNNLVTSSIYLPLYW